MALFARRVALMPLAMLSPNLSQIKSRCLSVLSMVSLVRLLAIGPDKHQTSDGLFSIAHMGYMR